MGMPCIPIPVGRVPLKLFEGDTLRSAREVILRDKGEYVFQPVITTSGQLVITGKPLIVGSCQALDFEPVDGGTTDGGGDGAIAEAGAGEAGGGADAPAGEAGTGADGGADASAPDAAAADASTD
jgi:hypothetical protein